MNNSEDEDSMSNNRKINTRYNYSMDGSEHPSGLDPFFNVKQ